MNKIKPLENWCANSMPSSQGKREPVSEWPDTTWPDLGCTEKEYFLPEASVFDSNAICQWNMVLSYLGLCAQHFIHFISNIFYLNWSIVVFNVLC